MKAHLSILTLFVCFAPALILAQSNSSKAWTAWTVGNTSKAIAQAEKLLDREESNALANCVMGYVDLEINVDHQEALRRGLLAQTGWRTVVTSEQRNAWRESGFGIEEIQQLIEEASLGWAEAVLRTPSTQDDLSFLANSDGVPEMVRAEVLQNLQRMEFERAKEAGTRDAFQAYMNSFPMSNWNQDALHAIQTIDFEQAQKENSLEKWREFIRRHPLSSLVAQARQEMDRLAYVQASNSSDANELEGYLNEFPKGAFVNDATRQRDSLEWGSALQDSSLALMRSFVDTRKNSHLAREASETLGALTWSSLGSNASGPALVLFIDEFAALPQAELAAMDLLSLSVRRNQVEYLESVLTWDEELDSLDVLGSLMSIYCRYGRPSDYEMFASDYGNELSFRPVLFQSLSEATNHSRSLTSESDMLLSEANENFLHSLHAKSYETFSSLQEKLSPKGRVAMSRSLEVLIERGLENPWVTSFVESSNKEFQASERRLTDAVNSEELELVPVISADNRELLFCRQTATNGDEIYESMRANGRWTKAKSVAELNTESGHEAPLNISSDGTELIGFVSGEIVKSARGMAGWEPFLPMPELNISKWNADAQLVSTKEAYLFASRDDSTANIDLFVAKVNRNGKILTPELLGPTINTPYSERTPFLHPDMKTLYFSSAGHGGYGGRDVFMSKRLADTCWNCWSEPINLGWAINSTADEWGFKISTDGKMAYYSKNGDIHTLELPEEARPELVATVEGRLVDRYDQAASADIVWEDLETGSTVGRASTDPVTGRYFIVLPTGRMYGYFVVAEGYFGTSSSLDLRNQVQFEVVEEDIELVYLEDALDEEKEVSISINNLFFEYGSDRLTSLSNSELVRVANLLIDSQRKVKLTGHTDSIGGQQYNLELSERRAFAVKEALVGLDVPASLLDADGAGETDPVASNETDMGRKKNRRVELRFITE